MADWQIGFNFRATEGFVSDDVDEVFVDRNTSAYPKVVGGKTFGWESFLPNTAVDRNNDIDRRLAGYVPRVNNDTPIDFRLDLPATGLYKIAIGVGREIFGVDTQKFIVKDNTTPLLTVEASGGISADHVLDINGIDNTRAQWVAAAPDLVQLDFSSTILRVQLGAGSGADATRINHLWVEQVPVPTNIQEALEFQLRAPTVAEFTEQATLEKDFTLRANRSQVMGELRVQLTVEETLRV